MISYHINKISPKVNNYLRIIITSFHITVSYLRQGGPDLIDIHPEFRINMRMKVREGTKVIFIDNCYEHQ